MKILIINHYAGSLDYGMEYRTFYLAREWVKYGHTVDIIASDYSHLRMKNPNVSCDFQVEKINGITYYWLKTLKYKKNGIKRALTMFQFVIKIYFKAKKIAKIINPDVVIASSTYPLDTYCANRIAKLSGAKLVHEIHDMWPMTLIEVGGMRINHPFVRIMQYAENSFCKNSDSIVSLLPNSKDYLIEHGMGRYKFNYVPNGVVLEDWENPKELPKKHEEKLNNLLKNNKFILGYFGGHALSNALDVLIEVAKEIDLPDVHFVLVGEGMEKKNLQKKSEEYNLKNITFLPILPKECIPNLLRYFTCIYIGGKKNNLYKYGVSLNKLYDSMMAGKPIIYAIDSFNDDVIENECGISINDCDNITEIIKAIMVLHEMSEESLRKMGENAKHAVLKKYNYTVLAKEFEYILLKLIEK